MTNIRSCLTASNIKYLLAMYRLYTTNNTLRCVKIAQALDITRPSVHKMLNTLQEMKLVRKDNCSEFFFTEKGLTLAQKYSGYYNMLHDMLCEVLSDESDIRSACCAVLAEISEEGLSRLHIK